MAHHGPRRPLDNFIEDAKARQWGNRDFEAVVGLVLFALAAAGFPQWFPATANTALARAWGFATRCRLPSGEHLQLALIGVDLLRRTPLQRTADDSQDLHVG